MTGAVTERDSLGTRGEGREAGGTEAGGRHLSDTGWARLLWWAAGSERQRRAADLQRPMEMADRTRAKIDGAVTKSTMNTIK